VRDRLADLDGPWKQSRPQQVVTLLSALGLTALFVASMTVHLGVVAATTVAFEQANVMQRMAETEQQVIAAGLITPAFAIAGAYWALIYNQIGGGCDVLRVTTAVTGTGAVAYVAFVVSGGMA
jgi:ABC-type spermidine/putrescine transport system permease subunit II